MPSGAGVGSFAGGFGKGLANAMLSNRERSDEKAKEVRSRKDRLFQTLLPTYLENVEDPADLEPMLQAQFPDIFTGKPGKKGQQSPFDKIAGFLGPIIGMRGKGGAGAGGGVTTPPVIDESGAFGRVNAGQTSMPSGRYPMDERMAPSAASMVPGQSDAGPTMIDQPQGAVTLPPTSPAPAAAPGTPGAPAAGQRTLFGVPLMSHQQKIDRDLDDKTAITTGMMQRVREIILPALRAIEPAATLDDALRVAGISIPADRSIGGAAYHYGVDREALAKAMYGHDFGMLPQEQQSAVLAEEKKMLEQEANARGTGTANARFNAPVDIPTAQSTGVDVGTTAAQVVGQAVPTMDVQEQTRALGTLKQDVEHIRTLIGVLPSKSELAGVAPGAVLAAKRRMNGSREQVAALSAAVDQVVNGLARTRGQQRGAQTERDAERAYNALVQLQAGFLDPFGGDTRESAEVRIQETLAGLDRVLAGLPTAPVPKVGPAAGPAPARTPSSPATSTKPAGKTPAAAPAAPAGQPQMDDKGNIYIDGKLVIPAA